MEDEVFKNVMENIFEKADTKIRKLYRMNSKNFKIISLVVSIIVLALFFNIFINDGIIIALIASLYFTFLIFSVISRVFIEIIIKEINKRKSKRPLYSSADIINNKEFYKQLLNNYSSAELLYVDNYNDDTKTIMICTLVKRKRKNIIRIDKHKIIIINNYFYNLKPSEQYILKSIKDGKVDFKLCDELNNVVAKECINEGLIALDKNKNRLLLFKIFIVLEVLSLLWIVLGINGINFGSNSIFPLLSFLLNIFALFYFYILNNKELVRTNVGNQINNYLNALKNNINEDSIDNKDIKTWDTYFLYSVLFKKNVNVYKELENVIVNK